jgi:hypothetical protein
MLQNVHNRFIKPQLLLITHKAYFHLSDYVSSQNMQTCSDEDPHDFTTFCYGGQASACFTAIPSTMWGMSEAESEHL